MGKVEKGIDCSVLGCKNKAVRSVSGAKAEASGLGVSEARRAYLCGTHYKEFKNKNREERQIQKWRWSA